MGYARVPTVTEVAQFSVRGGILDVYGFGMAAPARIEWWGDDLASLRAFDLDSQRSGEAIERITVLPVRTEPAIGPLERQSLLDLLPSDAVIVLEHESALEQEVERAWGEAANHPDGAGRLGEEAPPRDALFVDPAAWRDRLASFPRMALNAPDADLRLALAPPEVVDRDIKRLRQIVAGEPPTVILCDNEGQLERLEELLGTERATLVVGALDGGFILPDLRGLTDHEIFRRARRLRRPRRYREAAATAATRALRGGDFVVHLEHGIGIYRGIQTIAVGADGGTLDVGYGKTEVALRAAFKAVQAGKQVAVLVPTTILAEQHGRTFRERLADYPVRIEVLSRFRSTQDSKGVTERMARGEVDIVIGTHRLLSRDVTFHDLGLLIVDEEHRFGVRHKERLKALKLAVDVLTLTATPIPRTLHLSLAGLRDLALLETPPKDRSPVVTFIEPWDDGLIEEALGRELDRAGQVYFVHNRIETIDTVAERVRALAPPRARVAVAHGKVKEAALDDVMARFVRGEVDILVSTMIVESGLDVPNANTMLVSRADQLGLAQLYQLRGRVGRSHRRAYCYLLVPDVVDADAEERLRVLEHHTDLGSGYRIALRDLELRGAGNLLGAEQSGYAQAVGFDTYLRWLQETVEALKGKGDGGRGTRVPPEVVLDQPAHLADDYVPDEAAKLDLYRRLARAEALSEIEAGPEGIRDRFGPPPDDPRRPLPVAQLPPLRRPAGRLLGACRGGRHRGGSDARGGASGGPGRPGPAHSGAARRAHRRRQRLPRLRRARDGAGPRARSPRFVSRPRSRMAPGGTAEVGALPPTAARRPGQGDRGRRGLGVPGGYGAPVPAHPDPGPAQRGADGGGAAEKESGRGAATGGGARRSRVRAVRPAVLGGSGLQGARRLPPSDAAGAVRPRIRQRGVGAGPRRAERGRALAGRLSHHPPPAARGSAGFVPGRSGERAP